MAICKLCKVGKQLIKKSHIFPNFLYTDFYDEQNRLRKFDINEMKKRNPRISKLPTGIYEGQILCNKCDNNIIGALETYMSLLVNSKKGTKVKGKRIDSGLSIFEIRNIDSKKLKLFLLSILFRASISSLSEFNDVKLGPYEEKIRLAILNNNIEELDIQISILKFARNSNFTRFIAQPIRSKIGHATVYSIIINGYLIIFFMKENDMSKRLIDFKVRDSDKLEVLQVPKAQVEKFIISLMSQ